MRATAEDQTDNSKQTNFKATLAVVGSLLVITTILLGSQLLIDDKTLHNVEVDNDQILLESPAPTFVDDKTLTQGASLKAQKNSIAILPFVAFSSDPEDEYFADGMVEELLNLLAKVVLTK